MKGKAHGRGIGETFNPRTKINDIVKDIDKDGNMKADLFGKSTDNATKHGLVYDLETDKFVPIKK